MLFLLLAYLYVGTGNHSDDYIHLSTISQWNVIQLFTLDAFKNQTYYFYFPILYYDFSQFYVFKYCGLFYDIIKVLTSFMCILLIYLFAKDYMHRHKALLFSTLFILFPTHDATNFWTIGQYMIITPALVMFSHHLFNNNKLKRGFFLGLAGSFSSYASPPFVLGLSLIFLVQKQYKKFALFLMPQLIYVIYYVIMRRILYLKDYRTEDIANLAKIFKQFVLQVATFSDAAVGPSFWIKIYYSLMQLSIVTILVGGAAVYLFFRNYEFKKEPIKTNLLYCFIVILFLAFGLYALTGLYPQMAFNLGNRVMVYGSLLMSFVVVSALIRGRKTATIVFALFIFSVLGISDHWKRWNMQQMQIIENIRENSDLKHFEKDMQLFVSHNQYSQFGKLGHIEFFSDGSTSRAIFKYATGRNYNVEPINKRYELSKDKVIDKKFGTKINVDDYMNVYDSKDDKLLTIPRAEIPSYINSLPDDYRHWIQLLGKDNLIRRLALYLMPRLDYAL